MVFRLSNQALSQAITHLHRYGDTDVFPHLPELAFLADEEDGVVDELAKLDLDSYSPGGAIEALAPKSRLGFRITHQLGAVDTLLLLGSVIAIGNGIEKHRPNKSSLESYSYRFCIGKSGQIFEIDRTFKDWLKDQQTFVKSNKSIKRVVITDISDYYARINFHRIENLLDECAPKHGAARFIKKHIKVIRATQSFGLPVGGNAARLLAELALSDTDHALANQGIVATRFVDDFRIFLGGQDNTYDVLGFLAEQLGINEGLSLNVAKTKVMGRKSFLDLLKDMTTDISDQAKGIALDTLTASLYFDERPKKSDLQKLKNINLLGFLDDEINEAEWDIGKIKVIFRALKIAQPLDAIPYIIENFELLSIFAKELCLLMQVLEKDQNKCFDPLLNELIGAIVSPPASSIQVIKTWLLEIFVRGIIEIPAKEIKKLVGLSSHLDNRQILLIRGRRNDKNYFRKNKTAFEQFSAFEQPCLIWGASCLPDDEYEKWIAGVKPKYNKPTGQKFLAWAKTNKHDLVARLATPKDDHPDW